MKFPTKILIASLVCMNVVLGVRPSSCLSNSETNSSNVDTSIGMTPEDITKNLLNDDTNMGMETKDINKNSQNHNTNMGMKTKDINKLKEYKDLGKACEELNKLLKKGDIDNFIKIPHETAIKVDNAIRNILELIFSKDKMYSAEYWINKIIENPEDDCKKSKIKKILDRPQDYIDSMDTGLCDSTATKVLYLLTPYINENKKSNIDARSIFGQMMLKLTTKEDLKKMALRMIFASFFSGTRESDDFLSEYELEINPYTLYKSLRQNPNKHKIYNLYFEDKKLEDFIKIAKERYTYIYNNY